MRERQSSARCFKTSGAARRSKARDGVPAEHPSTLMGQLAADTVQESENSRRGHRPADLD
jgi:hypothetical protein